MKVIIYCIFFGLSMADYSSLVAQQDPKSQLIPSRHFGIEADQNLETVLPLMPNNELDYSVREKSIKTYLMPPRLCNIVNDEVGYAISACAEYYYNFHSNFKENLSPDYILVGASEKNIQKGLDYLAIEGTISAANMPYGSKKIPVGIHSINKFTINNYIYLFREKENDRQKIFATKTALMRGNPIIVNMNLDKKLQKNQESNHPFIVVGYNDQNQTIELLSVWGNNWEQNGYKKLSYNQYTDAALNAYVLIPTPLVNP